MKKLLVFFALIVAQFSFSQAEEVKNYTWDAVPAFKEIPEEFLSYPAVVLKDYRLYDNRVGNYAYKAFVVKHCAIKILKDEGINDYNKVSINKKYVRDYRDLKARVIKSNGKIEELSKDRIIEKEGSDDRQFVFEGVEKGDIIEYYYVIKDFPDFSGVEYFQRSIPVVEGKFQLNVIPGAKAYFLACNGMFNTSTKKQYVYVVTDLPAYREERNATNLANLAKIHYFVDSNPAYGFQTFYWSLNNYAEGVNAKSMIKKFVEDLDLANTAVPLDDRLKKMDIFLKEHIELDNQLSYKTVFETKKISPRMVLYLYKDVLDYLKVPYKFIASTDKFDNKFDRNNIMPSILSEILIYIPETNKYLMPFYYWMPYGPPSSVCLNNDAVVFEKTKKDVNYNFEKIGGVSMNDNVNQTDSEITLDPTDMETVSVKKRSTYTGYTSYYYRNVMKYIPEDKVKNFVKNALFDETDVDLKSYTFENKEYRYNYGSDKPFTFNTEADAKDNWVENAGKNYLVTLGKVLGKQTNMYQETERINPVDVSYPKKYLHTITFNIPDGYTVKSIDNLLFNKQFSNEQHEVIGQFVSTAKVEGNTVRISIEEFYNFTHLELEDYDNYRDIINAAYDFSKAALVLTKA